MIYHKAFLHDKDYTMYIQRMNWHEQMLYMLYIDTTFINGVEEYMLDLIFDIDDQIVSIPDRETKL